MDADLANYYAAQMALIAEKQDTKKITTTETEAKLQQLLVDVTNQQNQRNTQRSMVDAANEANNLARDAKQEVDHSGEIDSWLLNQGSKTYLCNNIGGTVNCH